MITFDTKDKALATAFEAAMKAASVDGITGFTASVMTAAQYLPADPNVAPTLPRDFNRDLGAAIANALRSLPLRLPMHFVSSLPAPVEGGIIYVHNGAGGSPVLAFSDGSKWLRSDTRGPVS